MIVRNLMIRSQGKRLAVGIAAAAVGLVLVGGAAIATGALSNGDQIVIHSLSGSNTNSAPVWPTNANGQTYGSLSKSTSSATDPVLVQAIATNGKEGYVFSSQLNPPGPSSPAQALAQQAAKTTPQYIPVYAQDGTTVIGQFVVSEPSKDVQTPANPVSGG
jgi:hypothetical protein